VGESENKGHELTGAAKGGEGQLSGGSNLHLSGKTAKKRLSKDKEHIHLEQHKPVGAKPLDSRMTVGILNSGRRRGIPQSITVTAKRLREREREEAK